MRPTVQRALVFNLNYWRSWLFTAVIHEGKPWAVSPPCHAGCEFAHRIAWDGLAFATWREAYDAAVKLVGKTPGKARETAGGMEEKPVLPDEIPDQDLRVDVYTPGGVRVTHIPTGIVATVKDSDEPSHLRAKAKALEEIKRRIAEKETP